MGITVISGVTICLLVILQKKAKAKEPKKARENPSTARADTATGATATSSSREGIWPKATAQRPPRGGRTHRHL
ncbi:hypothetical protein AMTR_s00048p00159200 [Amborella trichopoda]|uniref:Uncharacterized protein n=1 Tax=Amborella trichopoda TaxID=13333 RepID=U5D5I2_AMBTC|nr:hypothetical protein AMTR_s00048p00159200 [Amborella trichopoda]